MEISFAVLMNRLEDRATLELSSLNLVLPYNSVLLFNFDSIGIHLYTMNNPYVARKITEAVSSLL